MTTKHRQNASAAPLRVDRRTTLKWLAATMAAAHTGCTRDERFVGGEIPAADDAASRLSAAAKAASATGYGTDANLMNPAVPWSRTMSESQLAVIAALCDLILPVDEHSPAASTLGVADFVDEWVSAPYPQQQQDRASVFAGLDRLEAASRARHGSGFARIAHPQQDALLQALLAADDAADPDAFARFFDRMRYLAVGAYYSTTEGMADIGYVGNVAIAGAYPGPSDEAMAHLAGVLDDLGLAGPRQQQ